MNVVRRYLLVTGIACMVSFPAFCEAPVVDDSENFALLDEQQAAYTQPAPQSQNNNDEVALAHDDQRTTGTSDNAASLIDKLQGVQQELQELRGQLEVQAHEITKLKQQQIDFYKDLDARIRQEPEKLGHSTPATSLDEEKKVSQITPAPSSTTNPARANPADEQISYLAAYELIKNKQYDAAVNAMQTFTNTYPQGGYTANAQYWLGELYMVKKDYPKAIQHFDIVLNQFPSSSKSSASLLKVGYALAASGQTDAAKKRLQSVVKNYPDTHAAALALAKLESLNS